MPDCIGIFLHPIFSCHNVPFQSVLVKYLGQFLALSEKTLPPTLRKIACLYLATKTGVTFNKKTYSSLTAKDHFSTSI